MDEVIQLLEELLAGFFRALNFTIAETRSKKRVYYKAKEASDYYEVKPS
jgi:hypothetical protein